MNLQIAGLLIQDGLTNGAIYALLALALVLVFAVTRVVFIPQGEFVAFGALSLAALQNGAAPKTIWLLIAMAVVATLLEIVELARRGSAARAYLQAIAMWLAAPLAIAALLWLLAPLKLALPWQVALAVLSVTALGPLLYRIAIQPVAQASVLVLLIISVAIHFVLSGLGLLFFGAEGSRTPAFTDAALQLGDINLTGQSLWVYGVSAVAIGSLYWAFTHTLYGKSLMATAFNRVGARLVGISPNFAGALTLTVAAMLGAFSGVLIGPITTVYYDSGFLVGLKGFVGAIIGGLVSYPLAAAGAILIGLIESFASFWASQYKEVIVFTLILPVLLWRSLKTRHHEEDQ
ncbi:MAG: branched-chain amino acid ABC transporter permease [Vicinamibacterales bacterium]